MLVPQVRIITKNTDGNGQYIAESSAEWLARVNAEYAEAFIAANKLGLSHARPTLEFSFVQGEYGSDRAVIHYLTHEQTLMAVASVSNGDAEEFRPEDAIEDFGEDPPF